MIKNFLRKFIMIFFIVIFFSSLSLSVQRLGRIGNMDTDKEITNMNEYADGNCVLVKKANRIGRFPFGERLYLYDVEDDKWKLLKNSMIPFFSFGSGLAVNNENVYYNKFFAEEGIELYSKETGAVSFEKEVLDQVGIYTISPEYMYYLKTNESCEFDNHIYRMNLKNRKKEVYLKGQFSFVLRQDHGCLYTLDEEKKEAVEITLGKKGIKKCKGIERASWIGYVNKEQFIIVNEQNIVLYDKKKDTKKYYVKDLKDEDDLIHESAVLKKNHLYFSDMKLQMYQLDLKTGKKKIVFSLGDADGIKKYADHEYLYPEIYFTKSYITVDLSYDNDSKRKFFVYSYDGELIREFPLPAL